MDKEILTLMRGIKKLRVEISDCATFDNIERYNNLIDCLLHRLFDLYGERINDGEV
jgi:ketol-acid reductoisomerase